MTKPNPNLRHHGVHPPTAIKPNVAVNNKPGVYTPPEKAGLPMTNPNPSLGRSNPDPNDVDGQPGDDEPDDVEDRSPQVKLN